MLLKSSLLTIAAFCGTIPFTTSQTCGCQKTEADWDIDLDLVQVNLEDTGVTTVYAGFGEYALVEFDKFHVFNCTNRFTVPEFKRNSWLLGEFNEVSFSMQVIGLNGTPQPVIVSDELGDLVANSAGFTLNKRTGILTLQPNATGEFQISMLLTDVTDNVAKTTSQKFLFEDRLISVDAKPDFQLEPSAKARLAEFLEEHASTFVAGETTEVSLNTTKEELFRFPAANNFETVVFELFVAKKEGENQIPLCIHMDKLSGALVTTPAVVGAYDITLVASDRSDTNITVHTWSVDVVSKQFAVSVLSVRARTADAYTNPSVATQQFFVNEVYLISPLALEQSGTEVLVSDLTYQYSLRGKTLDLDPLTFIQPFNGDISISFRKSGKHIIDVFVVNQAGVRVLIETMKLDAVVREVKVVAGSERLHGAMGMVSETNSGKVRVFKGQPFAIARKSVDEQRSTGIDDISSIIFSLVDGPDSVCFNQSTIRGSIEQDTTVSVMAQVGNTPAQVLETIELVVVDPQQFVVTSFVFDTESDTFDFNDVNAVNYTFNETLFFPPLNVTVENEDPDTELMFTFRDGPAGLLMDTSTGRIQGAPRELGSFTMIIEAVSGSSAAVVTTIEMDVKQSDAALGGGCGPGVVKDDVPFDGKYLCDCSSTIYEGDFCNLLASQDSSSGGDETSTSLIVGCVLGGIILTLLLIAVVFKYRAYQEKMRAVDFRMQIESLYEQGLLDSNLIQEEVMPREIRRECVKVTEKIGAGEFGEVNKGLLDESKYAGGMPQYMVAIKTVHDSSGPGADELIREASVMALVGNHTNIVSLIGVVTRGEPMLLLLSFCEHGSLLSALRDQADGFGCLHKHPQSINKFGLDIARGMRHLASKNIIHRDLAARNVLLDTALDCKIADFGLSRGSDGDSTSGNSGYYKSTNGVFPLRWTAPESMESLKFSTASDVWSYGIVLIEVLQFGAIPYRKFDNNQVIVEVTKGYKIPRPDNCPEDVYEKLLENCWHYKPEQRPSFDQITDFFEQRPDDEASIIKINASTSDAKYSAQSSNPYDMQPEYMYSERGSEIGTMNAKDLYGFPVPNSEGDATIQETDPAYTDKPAASTLNPAYSSSDLPPPPEGYYKFPSGPVDDSSKHETIVNGYVVPKRVNTADSKPHHPPTTDGGSKQSELIDGYVPASVTQKKASDQKLYSQREEVSGDNNIIINNILHPQVIKSTKKEGIVL